MYGRPIPFFNPPQPQNFSPPNPQQNPLQGMGGALNNYQAMAGQHMMPQGAQPSFNPQGAAGASLPPMGGNFQQFPQQMPRPASNPGLGMLGQAILNQRFNARPLQR